MLVILPAGLEEYFAEVAPVFKTQALPWEVEQEIVHRHGQEFLERLRHWGQ